MTEPEEQDHVLIVAPAAEREALAGLFPAGTLSGWEAREAESLETAEVALRGGRCDVLLVDESACADGSDELIALRERHRLPVLLLARSGPAFVTEALERGVQQWLPRDLALDCPELLAAALVQARRWGELRRMARNAGEALGECRRQVSRLVGLLSEATPVEPQTRWFSQTYILDRLQEEVARAERYRSPLSVILGAFGREEDSTRQLALRTAERLGRVKRRCDVAGRFGPHGFLLLLPQTAETGAVVCCRRLQSILEVPPQPIMAHFGVATLSEKTPTARRLLSRAEECLEQARASGDVRIAY